MFHACCHRDAGDKNCRGHAYWHGLPWPLRVAGCVLFGLLAAAAIAVVLGFVTMMLWNAILPAISSLPPLTFWQAIGLLILARLFTGRFSHGSGHGRWHHRRHEPSFGRYAAWWHTEGEAAFKAYEQRSRTEPPSDETHEP